MSISEIDLEKIILEVGLSKGYLDESHIFETVYSKDLSVLIIDLALNILDQSRVEVINGQELILFYQDTSIDQLTADNKIENTELNLFTTKKTFLQVMAEWFWKKDEEEEQRKLGGSKINVFEASKHDYIMQYIYCSHQYDLYRRCEIVDNLFVIFNQYLLFESISGGLQKDLISKETIEDVFCYDTVESYIVRKK